jgi:hypothetical protein
LREELERTHAGRPFALRVGVTQYPEDAREAEGLYRLAEEETGAFVIG